MIRKINYRKMDEFIRFSDDLSDMRDAIDYYRENNHQDYKKIVANYCKEACELNDCVHCDLFEDSVPPCDNCSNKSFERFFAREGDACYDGYIDTTEKVLEAVAVHAAWEIADKAAEFWLKNLSDANYYRIIANADLVHLMHQALYLFDPSREGSIDTAALIAARQKMVSDTSSIL